MHKKIITLTFYILGFIFITGCQTTNTTLMIDDPEFNLHDMQNKTVYITPAQIVENNIPKQTQITVIKPNDMFDSQNLDVDLQTLLAQNFTEGLDFFTVRTINKSFIIENNNGTQVIIPTVKIDNHYRARANDDFRINKVLTAGCDFVFVPLALQLDAVDNVNKPYKSIDLVEPGFKASINYVVYDVSKNKIAASGVLIGTAEKSGMIDNTLGRNAILLAMNNAIRNLLEEFRK